MSVCLSKRGFKIALDQVGAGSWKSYNTIAQHLHFTYVFVFLAQIIHHLKSDSVILFAKPCQVHRVINKLSSIGRVDWFEFVAIQSFDDQFVVVMVVLDLVEARELNVEDHPTFLVGKIFDSLR